MRTELTFLLNGARVDVGSIHPTTTLLAWLRRAQRLQGTKEGCGEGDCGACTVVVGERRNGAVHYRPLNACIAFLPLLDGVAIRTVEGLTGPDGTLHPVQSALIACHGSQCGFCTPGFVMALAAVYLNVTGGHRAKPNRTEINDLLSGNLCRCTGYGPIIDAAERMFDVERPAWDVLRAQAEANQLATFPTEGAMVELPSVMIAPNGSTAPPGASVCAWLPSTLDELTAIAEAYPEATVVSGATDVGLWVTKQHRNISQIIVTRRVQGFDDIRHVSVDGTKLLRISAGATYAGAAAELGAWSPNLGELIRRIGGPQVRASGTIGGNIANGSPIGDMAPALMALGATVHLRLGARARSLSLDAFFIDYGKQDRQPGEIVIAVDVPEPSTHARIYKVSKRFDDDISAVCGAFNLTIDRGIVTAVRLAFGGMDKTPKRALLTEQALLNRPFDRSTVAAAQQAMLQDFTPRTDMRATADYRTMVAQNLLDRLLIEWQAPDEKCALVGPRAFVA